MAPRLPVSAFILIDALEKNDSWLTTLVADDGPFGVIMGGQRSSGGFWMPMPGYRRQDAATGELLVGFFDAFESAGNDDEYVFRCMELVEDDELATVVRIAESVSPVGGELLNLPSRLQRSSPTGELLSNND